MRQAGTAQQPLAFAQGLRARLRVGDRPRQACEERRTDEAQAGLAGQVEGLFQVMPCRFALPLCQANTGEPVQQSGLVPPRPRRARQHQAVVARLLGFFHAPGLGQELRQAGLREDLHRHHPVSVRFVTGASRLVDGGAEPVLVPQAMAGHAAVRGFDAHPVPTGAQGHATLEVRQRAAHPALRVLRIAQAAQGQRFAFDAAGANRVRQRELVLGIARRHLALSEQQVAAQVVNLRALQRQAEPLGDRLGLVQRGHRSVEGTGDAVAGGHAHPSVAALNVVRRDLGCGAERGDGVRRAAHLAQHLAAQQRQVARRRAV